MKKLSLILDTSSYCDLFKSQDKCDKFFTKINNDSIAVYVPETALFETAEGGDHSKVCKRLKFLPDLKKKFPKNLKIALNPNKVIIIEIKKKGRCQYLPTQQVFRFDELKDKTEKKIEEYQKNIKKSDEELDKRHTDEKETVYEGKIKDIVEKNPNEKKDFKGIEKAPRKYLPFSVALIRSCASKWNLSSKTQIKKIIKQRIHYKCLRSFTNLAYFYILTGKLSGQTPKSNSKVKGNENDLQIASLASYTDFLITEDKKLIEICKHLGKDCLGFQAMNLSDFERGFSRKNHL